MSGTVKLTKRVQYDTLHCNKYEPFHGLILVPSNFSLVFIRVAVSLPELYDPVVCRDGMVHLSPPPVEGLLHLGRALHHAPTKVVHYLADVVYEMA
jgi:hypothetical protein